MSTLANIHTVLSYTSERATPTSQLCSIVTWILYRFPDNEVFCKPWMTSFARRRYIVCRSSCDMSIQTNEWNLNVSPKLKLLCLFCNSLGLGVELWYLSRCDFDCINVVWRKALKRVWSLPWRTHSSIPYSLCNTPYEEYIYRRSLLCGKRCITSESSVVRYVSRFGIKYGLMHSVSLLDKWVNLLGENILFRCQRYGIKVIHYVGLS